MFKITEVRQGKNHRTPVINEIASVLHASPFTAFVRLKQAILVNHAPPCLSLRCANNGLCQQETSGCYTERQWGFYSHFTFFGLDELADSTAEILFHFGFSPFCRCFSSGEIDFPTLVGKAISKANSFATGVKIFPWKCLKTNTTSAVSTI